jgi:release factor glutamine methyltransferase
MTTIQTILTKYRPKIASLDLELLIAHELKKSREFVLIYPEYAISDNLIRQLTKKIARRKRGEPLAHILGHKEFYGLDFKVTKDTLIPRPETELLVDLGIKAIEDTADTNLSIVDVGTGSGNIIISIARAIESKNLLHISHYKLRGIDISDKALGVAKYNAKKHNKNEIKFIKSNLLDYFLKNNKTIKQFNNLIILANLPYLSREIYSATAPTVKNFEPKSALISGIDGLRHYEQLLKQIQTIKKTCCMLHVACFMEISPEQKNNLTRLIKKILPTAKIRFKKDLAGKWRICVINLFQKNSHI